MKLALSIPCPDCSGNKFETTTTVGTVKCVNPHKPKCGKKINILDPCPGCGGKDFTDTGTPGIVKCSKAKCGKKYEQTRYHPDWTWGEE